MTIKVVSVNGKRMPKAIYNQLPHHNLLSDQDCTMAGRPWGTVIDPKFCRDMRRSAHWHVRTSGTANWRCGTSRRTSGPPGTNLQSGGSYEPNSRVDGDFIDACALETHQESTGFFQGKVSGLIWDRKIKTTIEDIKVYLGCSRSPY